MTTPTFLLSDEQQLLRSTVRALLAVRVSAARVREVMLGDDGFDHVAWKELAELGLVGLAVPEEDGGAGAGFVEVALVAQELGRCLAPVPFLSSAVLGTTAFRAAADDDQLAEHQPGVAAGTTRLALAHLGPAGRIDAAPDVRAAREGGAWWLDGGAGYVIDGGTADLVVTAAQGDDGLELFLVRGDAFGLERTPVPVLDLTRPLATLTYSHVRVDETARLRREDAADALDRALTAGAVALASEQVGGTEHVFEETVAYARERRQFGRAIGSFQAVKHRLAELLVEIESARSAAHHAARVLAAGDRDELAIAARLAISYCSEVYERAAGAAIQLHGGIGFTWEHDAHLYFKRAKATTLLLGDPRHHRRRLADALGL